MLQAAYLLGIADVLGSVVEENDRANLKWLIGQFIDRELLCGREAAED